MYRFASVQPSALPDLRFAPSEIGLYHEQLNFEHIQHFILLPCSSRSYYILADSQSQLIILQPMRCINALNFTASASTSCSCWPTCHSPRHAVNTAREHRRQPARQLRGCCSTTTCSPLCSFLFFEADICSPTYFQNQTGMAHESRSKHNCRWYFQFHILYKLVGLLTKVSKDIKI